MSKSKCRALLLAVMAALLLASGCLAYNQGDPEVRGMWVQNAGFGDSSSTTTTVNNLANGNFNVICMYARWYGYLFFPPTYPNTEPQYISFNALDDMITKAHAQGLQVHAWFWANYIAQHHYSNPAHVMNQHPEWLMKMSSGSVANWLDPGVPDAMTWNYNVCMDIVKNHNVDGLHFDYIRYPAWDGGYNDIAIARFNNEFGRTGLPATDDSAFVTWRERQISDFVKRVYANAAAIKPNVCISAAVYGNPSNGHAKLQDWDYWMQKGYLDMAVPMIYEPAGASYWYSCLNSDRSVQNAYGRMIAIGQGGGCNSVGGTIQQINEIRDYGFPGNLHFSYTTSNNQGLSIADFCTALASDPTAYPTPVSFPAMPWKTTEGILKGNVTGQGGAAVYNATITINSQTDLTDGTGFYALMKLTPGTYTVSCVASGYTTATAQAAITAGADTTCDFALTPDGTPPVLSNIQATDIWSTLATISWTTDEKATGQVEYGLTTSYGSQTALNTAKLTSHSSNLSGLTPSTVYHYRVKSIDGTNNLAVSTDQTFTTSNSVQDIIIDNNNANNSGGSVASSSGSWTIASNLGGKYATDYGYTAHVAPPDTAWFKWTPKIIAAGPYYVYIWYPSDSPNAHNTAAPYTVYYSGPSQTFAVNQHINTGRWNLLGSFSFLAGTSGYVKVGNGTSASGTWVMADAAKFVYILDTQPPTAPTNLAATVIGPYQIDLSWTASTDNVGVAGYRIYRNGSPAATCAATTYSDTGLDSNAAFSYQVSAYDLSNNESAKSNIATGSTPALKDIIIDNGGAIFVGTSWTTATDTTTRYGSDYRYGACTPSTGRIARWTPDIDIPGMYLVYVWYPADTNRSTKAPFTIVYNGGSTTVQVNQTVNGGKWNPIAFEPFVTGTSGYVQLGNGTGEPAPTIVVADAIRFLYVRPLDTSPPTINSVTVSPPLVSGGAPIDVSVSATDDAGVASVTACGTALAFSGGNTYSGSIVTDPTLGEHIVNVVAKDSAGNQNTNTAQSYITARVFGLSNAALLPGGAAEAGAIQYLFKTWGFVTILDSSCFDLDDGSQVPVRVYCPGHGLTTGRFVSAFGIWNASTSPPQLDSQPGQIQVIY